jgi:hypothetical protein
MYQILTALVFGLFWSNAAAAQQPASAEAAVLDRVMEYRRYWLEDSTSFVACQVYERIGRPADFPAGLSEPSGRMLDHPEQPCSNPGLNRRRVAIYSMSVGETSAEVSLLVLKGERRHREDYVLARGPGNAVVWRVDKVSISSMVYFTD